MYRETSTGLRILEPPLFNLPVRPILPMCPTQHFLVTPLGRVAILSNDGCLHSFQWKGPWVCVLTSPIYGVSGSGVWEHLHQS